MIALGRGMFQRQQPGSAWATWEQAKLLCSSDAADRECVSFAWPLLQAQQGKQLELTAGTSTQQNPMSEALISCCSLPQPEETVAVSCVSNSAVCLRK